MPFTMSKTDLVKSILQHVSAARYLNYVLYEADEKLSLDVEEKLSQAVTRLSVELKAKRAKDCRALSMSYTLTERAFVKARPAPMRVL